MPTRGCSAPAGLPPPPGQPGGTAPVLDMVAMPAAAGAPPGAAGQPGGDQPAVAPAGHVTGVTVSPAPAVAIVAARIPSPFGLGGSSLLSASLNRSVSLVREMPGRNRSMSLPAQGPRSPPDAPPPPLATP